MLSDAAPLVFPALLILAGIFDCLTLKIPNWLTATVALLFFPVAWLTGLPGHEYLIHIAAALFMLAAGYGLYAAGLFGAGDAKLMAAAALWFGWPASMPFIVYTVLAGGVLAVLVLIWNLVKTDQEIRGHSWISRFERLKPNVPYGVAIAAGALLAYPQAWSMVS
ncbi:MAG: prepilin peptidase [Rhizobiales bacterium]|nr:prepilin peptidase [Hyphomicrobiales bacterium]